MRTYPRIRKAVKWGGAVVTAFILIVWGASGWWWVAAQRGDGWSCGLGMGCLAIGRFPSPEAWAPGIDAGAAANPLEFSWWFYRGSYSGDWDILIPIWIIAAPLTGITAAAWRLDTLARRRARAGLCPKCHYDRAGLAPGAVCPECGVAAEC